MSNPFSAPQRKSRHRHFASLTDFREQNGTHSHCFTATNYRATELSYNELNTNSRRAE
jgi:hypothetical protein